MLTELKEIGYTFNVSDYQSAYYEWLRFARFRETIYGGPDVTPTLAPRKFASHTRKDMTQEDIEDLQWMKEQDIEFANQEFGTFPPTTSLHIDSDLNLLVLSQCNPNYIRIEKLLRSLTGEVISRFSIGYSGAVDTDVDNTIEYIMGRIFRGKQVNDEFIITYWNTFPREFWIATMYISRKQYVRCLQAVIRNTSEYITRALVYRKPSQVRRILDNLSVKDPQLIVHLRISATYAFTTNQPVNAMLLHRVSSYTRRLPYFVPYPIESSSNIEDAYNMLVMSYEVADKYAIPVYSSKLAPVQLNYEIILSRDSTVENGKIVLTPEQILGVNAARNYLYYCGLPIQYVMLGLDADTITIDTQTPTREDIFSATDLAHPRYMYYLTNGTYYIGIYSTSMLSGVVIILKSLGITSMFAVQTVAGGILGNLPRVTYNIV